MTRENKVSGIGPGRRQKRPGEGPGRNPRYPWDRWFAGDHFVAVRGVDYKLSQASFVVMCRNEGWARGLSLSIVDADDSVHVWVRARRAAPTKGRNKGVPYDRI